MSNENTEPQYENMTDAEKIDALQNALDQARSDRDDYMNSYFDSQRELKRVKQELADVQTRISDVANKAREWPDTTPSENFYAE